MDLISVIVPVYNVEKYLDKCVQSIVSQTYNNLEIILINDGSKDSSGEICDDWKLKDKRIKVIHQKNCGVASARNAGINIAKGKFIGFVDSDDFIEKNMFEVLYSNLVKSNSDISICSSFDVINDIKYHKKINNVYVELNNEEAIIKIFERGYYGTGIWNKLIKKDLLKNNLFPIGYKTGEEISVIFNAIKNAKKIVYESIPLYCYVERNGSVTHSKNLGEDMVKNYKNIIDDNVSYLNSHEKIKNLIYEHYVLACFRVYNRATLYKINYHLRNNMYDEIIKNEKYIDYNNFAFLKKYQFKLFFFSREIYNFIVKIFGWCIKI